MGEEVGDLDFLFVTELLDYWLEYPPAHLLLRGLANYQGKKQAISARRARAEEMGDLNYREPEPPPKRTPVEEAQTALGSSAGARHVDCAPPHIQQAIERAKKGKHLEVPGADGGK